MHKENSFDLIRHFAALLVLFSHQFALSRLPEPVFLHWDKYGTVAVLIFFTISGYCMPASFSRSGHFVIYMMKRCCRIFPGLILCSLLMCYVMASFFTPQPLFTHLFSFTTLKQSLMYMCFMRPPIPGVFTDFLYSGAINGSLWTLPVEFVYYIMLGVVLSIANTWRSVLLLLGMFVLLSTTLTYYPGLNNTYYANAFHLSYLALYGIAFTSGALLSMSEDYWLPHKFKLAAGALVFLLFFHGQPSLWAGATLSLVFLTVITGLSIPDKLIRGRFDISYGIYIYAFPIQQMVINLITPQFWLSILLSGFFTIIMASLSYRLIEKPFLYASLHQKIQERFPAHSFSLRLAVNKQLS